TVCSWGPLAPGASGTCTATRNLTGSRINIATASGTSGGKPVTATATATVNSFSCVCTLGYPDASNSPRSATIFNESEVLRAFQPGGNSCATTGGTIRMFYNDEHALTLGVRRVITKDASGVVTSTVEYPVSAMSATPSAAFNPSIGASEAMDPSLRPIFPVLFITDVTTNATSRSGDWQRGLALHNGTG